MREPDLPRTFRPWIFALLGSPIIHRLVDAEDVGFFPTKSRAGFDVLMTGSEGVCVLEGIIYTYDVIQLPYMMHTLSLAGFENVARGHTNC